jgi:predicted transcriptional regulator
MNKAVMISINPKWCELIANGKKTVEVRKSKPKLEPPFKVYIYATKPKHFYKISEHMATTDEGLYLSNGKVKMSDGFEFWSDDIECEYLSGKVIGEFVCDAILSRCESANADIAEQQGCIRREELFEYAKGKELFGWHISDIEIYDTPMEINRFVSASTINTNCFGQRLKRLDRPPQSWCYVEEV